MDDREQRIRAVAHRIWEEEGCPSGREAAHWDMASELIAIDENQRLVTRPNPLAENPDARAAPGEPVEPLVAAENQGEFPTLTDQGEEQTAPKPRGRKPPTLVEAAATQQMAPAPAGTAKKRKAKEA